MVVKFSKGVHFDINNPNDLGWLVVLKKHSVEYVQLINEMECHWDSTYLVNVKVFEELFRDMKISLLLYGVHGSEHEKDDLKKQKRRWVQICTHLR